MQANLARRTREQQRHGLRRAALTAALLMVALTATADRWYEHYHRAEKALAEERWADAVNELNEALARRGDSASAVRSYGLNVIAYFPYLRLGQAYLELGRADAALAALETEERLGAVRRSREDLALLESLGRRARVALEAVETTADERASEVVERGLAEAALLAEAEHLDEAMQALSRVLAVAPEHPVAVATMDELRRRSVAAADAARRVEEGARLARGARAALEEGDAGSAATRLRLALELREHPEDRRLLEQTEATLRAAAGSHRLAETVEVGLAEVARLEAGGDLEEATAVLVRVLALAPGDERALALGRRLGETRNRTAEARRAADDLAEAGRAFAEGRWEAAISAANRVLARDAGQAEALELAARAYRELNRQVLGASAGVNLPPAIRFADNRDQNLHGEPVQVVRHPGFRLAGVVIDASPVRLSADGARGEAVAVTSAVQAVGGWFLTEFRLELELAPGDSAVTLIATDVEGLVSRSEYRVRYRRPAWRSPWAGAAGLGALAGAAVIVIGGRKLRQKRLRKRRFNPYVAGAPILDDQMFFGRERLVQRILQTVHHNSMLLHGERRIGKTSLQHHLKRRLEALDDPDLRFFPVFIDLQGTPETHFFATLATEVFSELEPHLAGLEPAARLDGDYQDRELMADLKAVLTRLREGTSKKVKLVLLIDEVDELNAYDPRVNQRLRGLFMKSFSESLVAVVSGVRIRRDWEHEGSPWYNFFEEIEITAFDREPAARLVTEPVRGVYRFEDDAVSAVVERTGGRPYAIQKLCLALVHRLHEEGRTRVTPADVEAIAPGETES